MRSINIFKIAILICFICLGGLSFGQNGQFAERSYRFPLDVTPSLSGSYGELRAAHFHAGVDFRIGGVSGARLYAAERGYISRITVSPTGYGRAIYITHPDGLTTIYGHMLLFASKIEDYVRGEQYRQESFSVNLYPDQSLFRIERGDFIGQAGNSGSSAAPHLHFEVRDTESQDTQNPLRVLDLDIKDDIAPRFEMVGFYSISNVESIPVRSRIASYTREETKVVDVSDTFYIAVAAVDLQNGTTGKLAVFRYRYFLDDDLIFSFSPDRIPSGMGLYINSVVEYSEKQRSGRNFMIKSWVEPGCGIKANIEAKNNGLFVLNDDNNHKVRIELWDEYGNMTERSFSVKRRHKVEQSVEFVGNPEVVDTLNGEITDSLNSETLKDLVESSKNYVMPWFLNNKITEADFRYSLSLRSLYSSVLMNLKRDTIGDYAGWRLHDNNTPLHRPGTVSIKADNIPDSLRAKSVLAIVDDSGKLSAIGGEWSGNWIEAKSSSFGLFTVVLDTIAPKVTPSFKEGETLKGKRSFSITIRDDLSGIADYKVYIDDKWVLSEYDAKNRRLTVLLDGRVISKDKNHLINIEVADARSNINQLKSSFIW
jgi:Membrane proteins related to metalloendopeptidases